MYSLPPLPLLTLDYPGASQRLFSIYPIIHVPKDVFVKLPCIHFPLPLLLPSLPRSFPVSVYPHVPYSHIYSIYIPEVTLYSLSPPSSSTYLVYPGASQRLFTPIITAMDSTVRQTRRELVESAAFP